MPKPVKKTVRKKSPTPGRYAAEAPETTPPPDGDPFEDQYRKRMSDLGRKGGKISGAKRMDNLSAKTRREIALKAAAARWSSRKK